MGGENQKMLDRTENLQHTFIKGINSAHFHYLDIQVPYAQCRRVSGKKMGGADQQLHACSWGGWEATAGAS